LLKSFGVTEIRVCDPPLADSGQSGLCTMAEITTCEVISFHVPLSNEGNYPTRHMINAGFLGKLTEGTLLVNTSRGKIVSGTDLLRWLQSSKGSAALDVFPDEPLIEADLLEACTVTTPHVAGNSQDGKIRGTLAIYTAFCAWLGVDSPLPGLLEELPRFSLNPAQASSTMNAVLAACPVERDDEQLRQIALLRPELQPAFFDGLRKNYPPRRDFTGWNVPADLPREHQDQLKSLGFH